MGDLFSYKIIILKLGQFVVSHYGITALEVAASSALLGSLAYGTIKGYEEVTFPAFTLTALIGMGLLLYNILKQADNEVHLSPTKEINNQRHFAD